MRGSTLTDAEAALLKDIFARSITVDDVSRALSAAGLSSDQEQKLRRHVKWKPRVGTIRELLADYRAGRLDRVAALLLVGKGGSTPDTARRLTSQAKADIAIKAKRDALRQRREAIERIRIAGAASFSSFDDDEKQS